MYGYKINKKFNLVVLKYAGEVTTRQIGGLLRQLANDPDYSSAFNTLSDFLELTSTYTYEELASLSSYITDPENRLGQNKNAYLVSTDVAFGMSRVWAAVRETVIHNSETMIFRDLGAALEWLGLPAGTVVEFPF